MRFASFAPTAALAAVLLLQASFVWSAEPVKSSTTCGGTAHEAIAAAEKALAGKSAEDQQRALACLLVAVKQLEAERLDIVNNKVRMLVVPRTP